MTAVMMRELRSYFQTPVGYVIVGLFLLVTGVLFTVFNMLSQSSDFSSFLSSFLILYVLVIPLLTMRLWSEERRQRTDQLLLTSPITVTQIVVGKFLAAFIVYLITMVVTMLYAVVVGIFGDLIVSQTIGAYIGLILLGASLISVGVLISASAENQVSAAFFSVITLLLIFIIRIVKTAVPQTEGVASVFAVAAVVGIGVFFFTNTRNWIVTAAISVVAAGGFVLTYFIDAAVFRGLLGNLLDIISLFDRLASFSIGIVKLEEVVFHLSFTSVLLFITIRLIERRRWA